MKPTKVTPLQNNRNHNNVCRWHRETPTTLDMGAETRTPPRERLELEAT
jgi:hypothetical protein